jgi:Fe-S oxidoreductase
LENFIAQHIQSGNRIPTLMSKSKHILFHGHCHQKALFGTDSIKTIFSSIADVVFEEIPSGCCGMAGSFGYEKEHYSISKKIGEEVLFPAIRAASKETAVIASGFSCRHQILDFTQQKAMHWVEIIDVAS